VGFFGFFESIDDPEVASALVGAAADWLKERSLAVLRGPTSFSTNDECGLLVDGFQTPPTVMMPHNPRYYATPLERAGLRKAKDLLVYESTSEELPSRLVRGAELLQQRYAIHVRDLEMARFEQEVDLIKRLYNVAWERNWGFIPMTDAELDFLAAE